MGRMMIRLVLQILCLPKNCFKCYGYDQMASNCPNNRIIYFIKQGPVEELDIEDSREERPMDEHQLPVMREKCLCFSGIYKLNLRRSNSGLGTTSFAHDALWRRRCAPLSLMEVLVSCENVASTRPIEKLKFFSQKHSQPYSFDFTVD